MERAKNEIKLKNRIEFRCQTFWEIPKAKRCKSFTRTKNWFAIKFGAESGTHYMRLTFSAPKNDVCRDTTNSLKYFFILSLSFQWNEKKMSENFANEFIAWNLCLNPFIISYWTLFMGWISLQKRMCKLCSI